MNYDLDKIRSIPIPDIAKRLGLEFNRQNKARCIRPEQHKNGDSDPSLSYDPKRNILHCFVCDLTLDTIEVVKQIKRCDFKESCKYIIDNFHIAPAKPKSKPQLKETKLSLQDEMRGVNFNKYLIANFDDLKNGGKIPACWTLKTIEDLQIGFDRSIDCITYLYFNEKCETINIHWHKKRSIPGHGGNVLYPMQALDKIYSKDRLLIFAEGKKDTVSLISLGFQAVTSTTGAGSIPKDLSLLSGFKKVLIVYDHDEAGKTGAEKLAQRLKYLYPGMTVCIHNWADDKPAGYDVTDYFSNGGNKNVFKQMLKYAEPFECQGLTEIEPTNNIEFPGQTLIELMENDEPAPTPIISRGLLDPNSILMITGAPKVGKSILAANLALSLVAGKNWFDFEISKPYSVAYFQAEMKSYRVRKRFKSMLLNEYNPMESLFITNPITFNILDENYFKSLEKFLIGTDVLIIDPFINYHQKNENDNSEMQEVMSQFRRLVNNLNLSIIIIHHNRKSVETSGGSNARGASSIFGSLDGLIEMRRKNDLINIHFDLRYDGAPDEMQVKLNPSSLWFERIDEHLIQDSNKRILELVNNSDTGILKSKLTKILSTEFSKSENTTRKWINDLVKIGVIGSDGSKRNPTLFTLNRNSEKCLF
ncbi:MAG: AAA family ATPase [Candidatus Marinimicrobia bacterium]|nr:AAA family ATPase [Candidatus Neomarinimicrobiota bacterium]